MNSVTPPEKKPGQVGWRRLSNLPKREFAFITSVLIITSCLLIIVCVGAMILPSALEPAKESAKPVKLAAKPTPTPAPTPTPTFDPTVSAVLPANRIVAFYAVPGAEVTGPAYAPGDAMLAQLKQQGNGYTKIDPMHPVRLGIDLVVSVPDAFPGPQQTYSHHVDPDTIKTYIDFCQNNNLLLFLDLNIGWAPAMNEVNFFLPYLQQYSFVHMAIDPEWMFPRHDGIPGTNLSNVSASDLNPIIEALADVPMKYHVPRKVLIIHQYRPDGDGLPNPHDAGRAEIADKADLMYDPRVDVVLHVDSVGGYVGDHEDKKQQYTEWVRDDMQKYHNFLYGGFKLFYNIEAKTGVMSPQEVLSLDPPPMVVTYGN